MKKALFSCLCLVAGTAMALAQTLPEYPQKLDFTLNGEQELSDVTVTQKTLPYDGSEYLKIDITGKSSSNSITMDFETPEGWEYALIASFTDESGTPMTTRAGNADHWYPISAVTSMGYKKGNSFDFTVNEKPMYGSIFLVSEKKVWEYAIDIEFNVTKKGAEGSGVESIDCPSETRYYTLQGAEVASPKPGMYVKVNNGRAYKVVVNESTLKSGVF